MHPAAVGRLERGRRAQARATPAPPPMSDNSTLSVSSWRTSRERLAPSASRTATSRRRADGARQQQVRDVGAGNQQHRTDDAPEEQRRRSQLPTLIVTALFQAPHPIGCSGPDGARRVARPAGNCVRTNSDATLSSWARLLDPGAGLQPADPAIQLLVRCFSRSGF